MSFPDKFYPIIPFDIKEDKMRRRRWGLRLLVAAFFFILLIPSSRAQQSVTQAVGNGEIDWSEQVIRATGSGAPNPDAPNIAAARLGAERAGKADALRNILEIIKGVRIDSETLVVNAMTQNDVIRTRVQGIVRGARVVNTRYLSDGAVEVKEFPGAIMGSDPDGQPGGAHRLAGRYRSPPTDPGDPDPEYPQGGEPGVHRGDLQCPGFEYPPGHVP